MTALSSDQKAAAMSDAFKPLADLAIANPPAPLTLAKAVERMRELFPQCETICAEKGAWFDKRIGTYNRYLVSLQPGLNGETCQNFQAESLECAIAAAVAFDPNEAKQGDRNEE